MNGFNLHAALQFAVGNLNQVVQQVQQQLQNINATINIKLPSNIGGQLSQLNTGIQTLNNNLNVLTRTTAASSASTSQLNTTLQQAQQALNNTSSAAQRTTQSISGSKDAMEEFGRVAGITARRFAGFVVIANSVSEAFRGISSAFKSALDFEREFVKLSQVGEAYRSDLQNLRMEIDRLSKSFGTSSQELLTSSVTLRQAGLNVREVTQALEALSKASLSPSFDDMKSTTEGLISIMAQFKLQARDMEGALGSINAVANAYAVESRDILEAVRRTGGAFRSVGGDLNEFIALFTSVRATTRESAESIATGMKTIFARIQRNDAVESLKEFGINLRYTREEAIALGNVNLERQFVGGYEAIQRLGAALRNIPTTDPRYARIIEDLGGYRQLSKVIPLIQETTMQQQALNIAQASGNSLTVSAEQAQGNFLIKIQKIKEEFLALGRTLMNSQGFQTFLDTFVRMGNVAVTLLDKISPLIPMLTALAAIKFTANLGSFMTGFGEGLRGNGPRRYATGGPVDGFGSGDTVPAMLSPGEHVLTRQQVTRMGGHSNVQKFANGGQRRYSFGNRTVSEDEILAFQAFHAQEGLNPTGFQTMDKGLDAQSRIMLGQQGMDISVRKGFKQRYLDLKAYMELRKKAGLSNVADNTLLLPFEGDDLSMITSGLSYGSLAGPFTAGATNVTLKSLGDLTKNPEVKKVFDSLGIKKIQASVNARPVTSDLSEALAARMAGINLSGVDDKQFNSIAGQIFESEYGFKVNSGDLLDLLSVPENLKSKIFGNIPSSTFADLKFTQNADAVNDTLRKYIAHHIKQGTFGQRIQTPRTGFAKGGMVVPGQGNFDTFPADLEPGAFVIKKSSAEAIGHENLARMKFATGGLVQSKFKIGQLAANSNGDIQAPTNVRGDSYKDVTNFISNRLSEQNKAAASLVASRFYFNSPFSTHILENQKLKKALEPGAIDQIFQSANKVIKDAFPGKSYNTRLGTDTRARETLAGYVFEGMISAMSNMDAEGGTAPLDFIFDSKAKTSRLNKYFSGNPGELDFADAKRTSQKSREILSKFVRASFQGKINALTDDPRFESRNLNGLAREEIKSGRVSALTSLRAEIATARQEEQALRAFGQKKAGGGPITNTNIDADGDEIIPSSHIERAKRRIKGMINRHYGMTGVDLTQGLREIKFYSPSDMEGVTKKSSTQGFFQGDVGVLGLKHGIVDLEKTLIHEGYHGLDAYRGRLFNSPDDAFASNNPNDKAAKSVVDMISQFVSNDLSKVPNASTREYLSRRQELLAFSAQGMIGESTPIDTFSKTIPKDKLQKLSRFSGRNITKLFRDLPGNIRDLPETSNKYSDQDLFDKIKGTGVSLFKFANGGRSPQDTVPALLTPGEFVFSRDMAERIGYNKLHHMNTKGEIPGYNKGGIVEMASGGTMPWLSSSGQVNTPMNPWTTSNPNNPQVAVNGVKTLDQILEVSKLQLKFISAMHFNLLKFTSGSGGGGGSGSGQTNQSSSTQDYDIRSIVKMAALAAIGAGASYLAEYINTSAGTAANAAAAGTGSDYVNRRAMASGVQSGAVGGIAAYQGLSSILPAASMLAGPLALLAAGGVGVASYLSAQNAANAEIAGANVELAQRELGDRTSAIARRGTGFVTNAESQSISDSIQRGFTNIRQQAISQNTQWYGSVNMQQADAAEQTARRAFIQSQSAEFNRIISDSLRVRAEEVGRDTSLTPAQLRERLSSTAIRDRLLGGNQAEMFRTLAMQPGESQESIAQRLSEQAIRQSLNERASLARQENLITVDRTFKEFDRLAEIVSKASSEIDNLRIASETMASSFEGRISGTRFSFGGGNVRFGLGDNAQFISGVSSGLGSPGESLRQAGMAYDTVRRELFNALSNSFSNNAANFDEAEFSIKLREALVSAIGPQANNEAFRGILSVIQNNSLNAKFDDIKRLVMSGNTSAAAEQLLKGSNIPQVFQQLKSEFEQFFNNLNSSFTELEKRHAQLDEILDKLSNNRILSLGIERQLPFLQAGINPSGGQGVLTVDERNRPFNERIARIAAEVNAADTSPQALAARYNQLMTRDIPNQQRLAQNAFNQNPSGQAAFDAARGLTVLQRQANEVGQALKELGDVAERTKAAQDRLAQLNNEQANRASLVQRLLTGGPGARMQHMADIQMYQRVIGSGRSLESLPPQLASRLLQTLSSINFPISQLPGSENLIGPLSRRFGMNGQQIGQLTGADIANREMGVIAPNFVNPPAAQQERDRLVEEIKLSIVKAREANEAQRATLSAVNERLSENLQRIHSEFLTRLEVLLAQNRADAVRGDLGAASNELSTRQRQYETRRTLAGFGILNQAQLNSLPVSMLTTMSDRLINGDPRLRDIRNSPTGFRLNTNLESAPFNPAGAWSSVSDAPNIARINNGETLIRQFLSTFNISGINQEIISQMASNLNGNLVQTDAGVEVNAQSRANAVAAHVSRAILSNTLFRDALNAPFQLEMRNAAQAAGITPEQLEALLRRLQGEAGRGLRTGISEFNDRNPLEQASERLVTAWRAFDAAAASSTNLANAAQAAADRLATLSGRPTAAQAAAGSIGAAFANPIMGGLIGAGVLRNSGGPIPGSGNTDTVPAMLTPGEFVINAEAVKRIGLHNLHRLNAKRFNDGGFVEAEANSNYVRPTRLQALQSWIDSGLSMDDALYNVREEYGATQREINEGNDIRNREMGHLFRNSDVHGLSPEDRDPPHIRRQRAANHQRWLNRRQEIQAELQWANAGAAMRLQAVQNGVAQQAQVAPIVPTPVNDFAAHNSRMQEWQEGQEAERAANSHRIQMATQQRMDAIAAETAQANAAIARQQELFRNARSNSTSFPRSELQNSIYLQGVVKRGVTRSYAPGNRSQFLTASAVNEIISHILRTNPSANVANLRNQISGITVAPVNNTRVNRNDAIADIQRQVLSVIQQNIPYQTNSRRFNSGGLVPGSGNFDSVPALVTPGEFVLNKTATAAAGVSNLQKFNNGGFVQSAYRSAMESADSGPMVLAMQDFIQGLNPFINAMNAFPHELSGSFTHNVNVNITGADVLQTLEPAIKELVESTAAEQLSRYVSENLYQAGPVQ